LWFGSFLVMMMESALREEEDWLSLISSSLRVRMAGFASLDFHWDVSELLKMFESSCCGLSCKSLAL
jgi:hypothetical protein